MKKLNNCLIEEIYYYFNINRTYEKDVISIDYDNGIQLNIILNERNYLKLIVSKMLGHEFPYNQLFDLINKNLPSKEGDSIIYSLTEHRELILWLRVRVEDVKLADFLNIIKGMKIEISDIANLI